MSKLRDHHEVTGSVGMPASWWSKKENVEKYVEAFFLQWAGHSFTSLPVNSDRLLL